jgi:hypothetical protein
MEIQLMARDGHKNTPPHILVNSVAGITLKLIDTFTKPNLLSAITFSSAVNVKGAGGRLHFGNMN